MQTLQLLFYLKSNLIKFLRRICTVRGAFADLRHTDGLIQKYGNCKLINQIKFFRADITEISTK